MKDRQGHPCHGPRTDAADPNYVKGKLIELNDNGGWSWFMDERTIEDEGQLLVGSVRANGTFANTNAPG